MSKVPDKTSTTSMKGWQPANDQTRQDYKELVWQIAEQSLMLVKLEVGVGNAMRAVRHTALASRRAGHRKQGNEEVKDICKQLQTAAGDQ